MINDLRRFRLDPREDWKELDLKEILDQAIHDFERNLEIEDSPLQVNALPDERVMVQGNHIELSQVFLNLFDNARKAIAGQNDGKIEVSMEEQGDVIRIGISDDGPGIEPEIIKNLDNLFYSAEDAKEGPTSRMLTGGGLGLPTCKRVLATHEANLEIQSTPDLGTRVLIEFPRNLPAQITTDEPSAD